MAKACRVKEVYQVFSFIDMEYFKDNQKWPVICENMY